ncbi:transcription factor RFX4, partial [Lingula anatina]|uniref:DNA-binding protein RFX6 n=1 Tax=Lingula anatina TaxID=7574 RepID=A0A1S3JYR3_LINAN
MDDCSVFETSAGQPSVVSPVTVTNATQSVDTGVDRWPNLSPDIGKHITDIGNSTCGKGAGFISSEKGPKQAPIRPHSTPLTLKWLDENYEVAIGVCIPRNQLYLHYLDFCDKNRSQPVNAASFGKIIRQQFPSITTRRLGTRGQSKYHYYGVGVKESSPYYDIIYSKNGMDSKDDSKTDNAKPHIVYSPRSKLGTLLPEFPEVKDIKLPPDIPQEKVITFVMMYRTHCQRILDTVIRANFDEVQNFLLYFWQGMPSHIIPILGSQTLVSLVGVCDAILYKAIASVLIPTILQSLPDSLTQDIRKFAKQLIAWTHSALETLPENLCSMKLNIANRFAHVLRRQTALNHLCQAARGVAECGDVTDQMLDDWRTIDIQSVIKQTLYTLDKYRSATAEMMLQFTQEFEDLMENQGTLESYAEWLDSLINTCVITPSFKSSNSLKKCARQFLLLWSCFGTRVIRDMTLHSAPSFGSFHLLHLMFDDYVMFKLEMLHRDEETRKLAQSIKGETVTDKEDDCVFPDASLLRQSTVAEPAETGQNKDCHGSVTDVNRNSVITSAVQKASIQEDLILGQGQSQRGSQVHCQGQSQRGVQLHEQQLSATDNRNYYYRKGHSIRPAHQNRHFSDSTITQGKQRSSSLSGFAETPTAATGRKNIQAAATSGDNQRQNEAALQTSVVDYSGASSGEGSSTIYDNNSTSDSSSNPQLPRQFKRPHMFAASFPTKRRATSLNQSMYNYGDYPSVGGQSLGSQSFQRPHISSSLNQGLVGAVCQQEMYDMFGENQLQCERQGGSGPSLSSPEDAPNHMQSADSPNQAPFSATTTWGYCNDGRVVSTPLQA